MTPLPDPTQDSFEYTSEYAKMSHNPTEKDIQYVTVGDRKFISEEAHHQAVTEAMREAKNNEAGNIYELAWQIRLEAGASSIVAGGTDLDKLMNALERKYGKDLIQHVYGDRNAQL